MPDVQAAIDEARERTLDAVENKLLEGILVDGNPQLIQFFLKTQGRHRGYSERLEIAYQHLIRRIDLTLVPDHLLERISQGEDPLEVLLGSYTTAGSQLLPGR